MGHYLALATALILVACAESSLYPWKVSSRSWFPRGGAIPLCPSYPLPAASPPDLLTKLKPFLEEAAENISAVLGEDKSPGGAVVNIVYNDTVIWTKGFGLINDSNPSRGSPDGNTAFRIGSITKVFTALMMLMSRDGTLVGNQLPSLDGDITKYLPELKIQNPFQTKRGITFNQLSSHMAGLPRETPCPNMYLQGCNLSYDKIYDNLAEMELEFPPGLEPQYSNLGFAILGRTLEKFLGTSWEEALPKAILQPLGMNNSGNQFTPETIEHLAVGYSYLGTVAKLIDIGFEAPAGQMYSTTNDLAQLMKLLFRPEKPYDLANGQILDGETIREWMQPTYKYHDGTGFGHPWELVPLGNYTLRTKNGAVPGYNAEFEMAHDIKTGFIFLQSCDGCASHAPILEVGWQIILEVSRTLSTMQPPPRVPPKPTDYTGSYTAIVDPATPGVTLKIVLGEVASGHTALLVGESPLPYKVILEWVEEDKFQLSAQGMELPCSYLGAGQFGEKVHFQRGTNGVVISATIPGLTYGTVFMKV